jgi:hypothetical protein
MGNKRSLLFALVMLPCCAFTLMGLGAGESTAPESEPGFYRDRTRETVETPELPPEESGEKTVRVTGRVRLVGTALRNSLVVSGEDGEWYIEGGDMDALTALQQQNVTLEGRLYSENMVLANGQYIGKRLILREVRIIE